MPPSRSSMRRSPISPIVAAVSVVDARRRRGSRVIAVLPRATRLIGLAVDIGTTKLAAYLVDLEQGHTVAKLGAMNPQIAYGEDVISRIAYCNRHADGRVTLQRKLIETLNTLIGEMCREANIARDQIVEAVIVGNTAMHHLLAGLPVQQLGTSPYVAAISDALEVRARDVGLEIAPGASIYLPPNIAGFRRRGSRRDAARHRHLAYGQRPSWRWTSARTPRSPWRIGGSCCAVRARPARPLKARTSPRGCAPRRARSSACRSATANCTCTPSGSSRPSAFADRAFSMRLPKC